MTISLFDQETMSQNREMINSCPTFIPVGFKFNPTDEQLVRCYLLKKVTGNSLPFTEDIVKDCDIYGDKEPWQIWESLGNQPFFNDDGFVYVFTRLKQRRPKSSTIQRRIGSNGGSWHGEDSGKTFEGSGGIKWTQKRFRYENKNYKSQDGCWLMQEYSLDHETLIKIQKTDNNIVLCRIKKNEKKRKMRECDVMEAEIEVKRFMMNQSTLENPEATRQVDISDYCKNSGESDIMINTSGLLGETEEEENTDWEELESLLQEIPKSSNQNQVIEIHKKPHQVEDENTDWEELESLLREIPESSNQTQVMDIQEKPHQVENEETIEQVEVLESCKNDGFNTGDSDIMINESDLVGETEEEENIDWSLESLLQKFPETESNQNVDWWNDGFLWNNQSDDWWIDPLQQEFLWSN